MPLFDESLRKTTQCFRSKCIWNRQKSPREGSNAFQSFASFLQSQSNKGKQSLFATESPCESQVKTLSLVLRLQTFLATNLSQLPDFA